MGVNKIQKQKVINLVLLLKLILKKMSIRRQRKSTKFLLLIRNELVGLKFAKNFKFKCWLEWIVRMFFLFLTDLRLVLFKLPQSNIKCTSSSISIQACFLEIFLKFKHFA